MARRSHSLKFDLVFDLSLLTFCALILSQGIIVVLMRYELPLEFGKYGADLVRSAHREFVHELEKAPPTSLTEEELVLRFSEIKQHFSFFPQTVTWSLMDLTDTPVPSEGILSTGTEPFMLFWTRTNSIQFTVPGPGGLYRYTMVFDELHSLISQFKFKAFLFMVFAEIILVLIGYYLLFRRNLLIPIEKLGSFSKQFLLENWDARITVERKDELGKVAEALNEMAGKIQDKEKKLFLTIASLKQANAEIEARQNEQLQIEKLASIGRLAAGVAHEVGNPLGAILGYIDILRRGMIKAKSSSEDVEICNRIEAETNRISKIIRALLQQARPTSDRIQSVPLKNVVTRSLQLAQVPSTIDVSIDFEKEDANVSAEEDQLVQIFLNLIMNAKHSIEERKDRKEPGRLTIRCRSRKLPIYQTGVQESSDYDTSVVRALKPEVYWVVSVEDNGTGISDADQRKLFEPFFSTKAPGKGTGLGLYVTKSIVESFRGAIVVRSAIGFGASFSVFLPVAKSNFPFELMQNV